MSKQKAAKKIPTREELFSDIPEYSLDEKAKEFCEENSERVKQYLIDIGMDERIATRLNGPRVGLSGNFAELSDDDKRALSTQILRDDLASKLLYFMALLMTDPVLRLSRSATGIGYQKKYLKAYLERLEVILEDSSFVDFMGFDRESLQEKQNDLKSQLKKINSKRGGQMKISVTSLYPLLNLLSAYGYQNEHQRAEFLYNLFLEFKIPRWSKDNKKSDIKRIKAWQELYYPDLANKIVEVKDYLY